MKWIALITAALMSMFTPVLAASSFDHAAPMLNARLITAEDGVRPDASTLSGGLVIELEEGWHSYWKSPGQVGYPPSVDWSASENVASVDFQWPVPKRFTAFEIENYGYEDTVVHPLRIALETPGAPATLRGDVSLLVCEQICVPQDFTLTLNIGTGTKIDNAAAAIIAEAAARVPVAGSDALRVRHAALTPSGDALTLTIDSTTPLERPVAFVDMGPEAAFGPPITRVSGRTGTITLPVLASPDPLPVPQITIADGTRASVTEIATSIAVPTPASGLLWTLALAFIGGLILNIMPCVLPVLSIKFASALKSADRSAARIRSGFLVSALGVLSFMWALALVLVALRATGGQVGWGLQFQNPVFLSIMVAIMALFAANLAGVFEITLPQSWTTRMARADGQPGLAGDFATGALAAVMATPCSAPFLGTAVTVALAGSNTDTLAIFTALGLGLALPYLLIALRPGLVQRLPKPGAWMDTLRLILAGLMGATAIWLATVLNTLIGTTGLAILLVGLAIAVITLGQSKRPLRAGGLAAALAALMVAPSFTAAPARATDDPTWVAFDAPAIATAVADGQVVFVDVTAAWCLTCKANKSLVLDRDAVEAHLRAETTTAMRADWTRPDPAILAYLQSNDRFGIPFNMVYGPGAPQGIILPEILSVDAVMQAFADARG